LQMCWACRPGTLASRPQGARRLGQAALRSDCASWSCSHLERSQQGAVHPLELAGRAPRGGQVCAQQVHHVGVLGQVDTHQAPACHGKEKRKDAWAYALRAVVLCRWYRGRMAEEGPEPRMQSAPPPVHPHPPAPRACPCQQPSACAPPTCGAGHGSHQAGLAHPRRALQKHRLPQLQRPQQPAGEPASTQVSALSPCSHAHLAEPLHHCPTLRPSPERISGGARGFHGECRS